MSSGNAKSSSRSPGIKVRSIQSGSSPGEFVLRVEAGTPLDVRQLKRSVGKQISLNQDQIDQDVARRHAQALFTEDEALRTLSPAMLVHEQRLARLKQKAIDRYPTITAEELADFFGSKANRRTAYASRLVQQRRAFAVRHDGAQRIPTFQFNPDTWRPYEIIERALQYFDQEELQAGWPAFLWFVTPRPGIEDRIPAELVKHEPDAIIEALEFEAHARHG